MMSDKLSVVKTLIMAIAIIVVSLIFAGAIRHAGSEIGAGLTHIGSGIFNFPQHE